VTTVSPTTSPPTARPTVHRSRRPIVDGVDLLAIAQGLAGSATSWPGMTEPVERCWRSVAATDRFEAFVIAWPVGCAIELHDHGPSAGAVVVASGSLVETSVGRGDGTLTVTSASIPTGGYVVFEPGHVHDIVNDGPEPALSVHVYSPVLSTMTFFDVVGDHRLVSLRTESYGDGQMLR
jgi:Cysteine dioxygenase type I